MTDEMNPTTPEESTPEAPMDAPAEPMAPEAPAEEKPVDVPPAE